MIQTKEQLQELIDKVDKKIEIKIKEIEKQAMNNSRKVLKSFQKYQISEAHFGSTSGYGYNDLGRDTIEKVFADILGFLVVMP